MSPLSTSIRRMEHLKSFTAQDADRFWHRVAKGGPDECWMWEGPKNRDGYGTWSKGGRKVLAHRAALALDGRLEADKCALHSCDAPGCVNPRHLFSGSQADNMLDMARKGRQRGPARGHSREKIDASKAREIRRMRAGGALMREIAERFGVTTGCVSGVIHGYTWRHA